MIEYVVGLLIGIVAGVLITLSTIQILKPSNEKPTPNCIEQSYNEGFTQGYKTAIFVYHIKEPK